MKLASVGVFLCCVIGITAASHISLADPVGPSTPRKAIQPSSAPSPTAKVPPTTTATTRLPAKGVSTPIKTGSVSQLKSPASKAKTGAAKTGTVTSTKPLAKPAVKTTNKAGPGAAMASTSKPSTGKSTSSAVSSAAASPAAQGTPTTQKPLALQGYVKHHHHHPKHGLGSLLKKEFDSPIHAVETDNKDF
jgi:hypothetical protein